MKNRIREYKEIPVSQIIIRDDNWRLHTDEQKTTLTEIFEQIGFAGVIIVREIGKDQYEVLDGHLRLEMFDSEKIPSLVVDLNDDEAKLLLATYDIVGEMAETDIEQLSKLLDELQIQSESLLKILETKATIRTSSRDGTDFKSLKIETPFTRAWVLIGIPIERFSEISDQINELALVNEIILETTVN